MTEADNISKKMTARQELQKSLESRSLRVVMCTIPAIQSTGVRHATCAEYDMFFCTDSI